jgi:rsbT antagonist protein RsbS
MARIPLIRLGDLLIVTVLEEVRDSDALALQHDLMDTLQHTGARGVLLDMTVVETIDSFLGRLMREIAVGARLMGAATVIVGIQPAVAITLVELGLELKGLRTALNAQKGLALLHALIAGEDSQDRDQDQDHRHAP